MATAKPAWGIIRYAPGSGVTPEDDCAAFDGWYTCRQDALDVYQAWCKEFPHWIIALVSSVPEDMRFSERNWQQVTHLPDWAMTICPLKRNKQQEAEFQAAFEKIGHKPP